MKAYITKYALTRGIIEVEGERYLASPERCFIDKQGNEYYNNEWSTSQHASILRAEQMRDRKIASLEKQIEKLKNKKF